MTSEKTIDTTDIPEAGEAFFKKAKLVRPDPACVDSGCGCVWCDLDVKRIKLKRQHVHRHKFRTFVCTRIDHMSYPAKPLSGCVTGAAIGQDF